MYRTPSTPRLPWLAAGVLVATAAVSTPAGAEELTLRLDPAATEVSFHVDATGHDVHGDFALQSGEIRFDPDTGTASGEIRVDAASAKTGNGSRDKEMNHEVLESDSFPLFVFRPERVTGELAREGASEVQLSGQLDVHGSVHPVTLPAKVEIDGDHVTARASFPVPYVEWGMKKPGFLFLKVAPVVSVDVDATGSLQEGASAQAAAAGSAGGR